MSLNRRYVGCDACMCEDVIKSSLSPGVDAAAAGRGVAVHAWLAGAVVAYPGQLLATARPDMSFKLD